MDLTALVESIPNGVLIGVFAVVLLLVVGASASFMYHWKNFGLNTRIITVVSLGYNIITISFLVFSLSMLLVVMI